MNLKTKLIITFAVVIAVPLFLITVVFAGFMSLQPVEVATPQTREFLGEMLVSVILIMAMQYSESHRDSEEGHPEHPGRQSGF